MECTQSPTQSALSQKMSTSMAKSGNIGVLVMQTILDLLMVIMEHMDNLKGSSINKVLHMWPSHYCQFGTFATKMSNKDRDTLQIMDPKVIQA